MQVFIADHPSPDTTIEQSLLHIAGMELKLASANETLTTAAHDAYVVLAREAKLDNATLEALPNLGLISIPGEGTNHVDVGHAEALGIWVCHVPSTTLNAPITDSEQDDWFEETRRLAIVNIMAWCTEGRPYNAVCSGTRLPPPAYRQPHLN